MIFSNLSARKKEVAYTIVSNLLLQVVTALCGFILPPLIIGTFGSSVNGMVSSISQFIAYLNIVEAGVGGASIAALYKPLALGDVAGRNGILSATAKFYNRSGVLFTVLVFVLAFVYPLIVGNEVDRLQSALMVLVLGITGAAEFFLIGKYRVLLTADKKMYVLSLVQMAAVVINTFVAVVLIKAGLGILIVKFSSAIVYLSRYIILALYVRKNYSEIDFHAEADTKSINQSKNVLVHQIAGLIVFNSPIVIITIFCTLKDASVYTVYAMVFNALNQLLAAFSTGIQSFFGESFVKESLEKTRHIFDRYETFFFSLVGVFFTIAYLLIIPFMNLYTAKMTDADYIQPKLAMLFIIVGILTAIRLPGLNLIDAAGLYKRTQKRAILEAIINIIASITFVLRFGFWGCLCGNICSYLYRTFDIIFFSRKYILDTKVVKSFIKIFLFFLLFLLQAIIIKKIPVSLNSFKAMFFYAVCISFYLLVMPTLMFFLQKKRCK